MHWGAGNGTLKKDDEPGEEEKKESVCFFSIEAFRNWRFRYGNILRTGRLGTWIRIKKVSLLPILCLLHSLSRGFREESCVCLYVRRSNVRNKCTIMSGRLTRAISLSYSLSCASTSSIKISPYHHYSYSTSFTHSVDNLWKRLALYCKCQLNEDFCFRQFITS